MSNTERDERVSRPRQIWLTEFTDNQDPRFILADWRTREVRNTQPGDFVAIRPHHKLEYVPVQAVNDAATRMRDRSVEKVREMRSGWEKELQYEEDFDWRVDTATKIITALQSLTLEGSRNNERER